MSSKQKFAVLAALVCFLIPHLSDAKTTRLTILHFNDFHGKFEPSKEDGKEIGGAARLAGAVKAIEEENAKSKTPTILLVGGDMFIGSIISRIFEGAVEIKFLNEIGADAMVIGNHDFDMGRAVLEKRMGEAAFPMLAANVFTGDGRPFAKAMGFIDFEGGPRVGIIGLAHENTRNLTQPQNVEGLEFKDEIETTKGSWRELDKNSDIQIALTHEGVKADEKLARAIPGLDAVVGGHDHVKPSKYCKMVKKTPVCQTPANARYLGRIDLEIGGKRVRAIRTGLIPLDESISPDGETASLLKNYEDDVDKKYGATIGFAAETLTHGRGEETPLGDLAADAVRQRMKTDIGIVNSGGIRRPLSKGNITIKDLYEIFPFDNRLVSLKVTGADLKKVLDRSAKSERGGFLQVSGVKFKIVDKKAEDIIVNGALLDTNRVYTVATVDFLSNGGDGYAILKKLPSTTSKILIRDAMIDYVKKTKKISIPEGGRIGIQDSR